MSSDRWNNKWPLLWASQRWGLAAAAGDDEGCLWTPFGTSAFRRCLYTSLWSVWRSVTDSRKCETETMRSGLTEHHRELLNCLFWIDNDKWMYFIQYAESEIPLCLCNSDLFLFLFTAATLKTVPTSFQLQNVYNLISVFTFSFGLRS